MNRNIMITWSVETEHLQSGTEWQILRLQREFWGADIGKYSGDQPLLNTRWELHCKLWLSVWGTCQVNYYSNSHTPTSSRNTWSSPPCPPRLRSTRGRWCRWGRWWCWSGWSECEWSQDWPCEGWGRDRWWRDWRTGGPARASHWTKPSLQANFSVSKTRVCWQSQPLSCVTQDWRESWFCPAASDVC